MSSCEFYTLCESFDLLDLLEVPQTCNFRRVTGMLDLGECESPDANNLPSKIYPQSLQTNDGYVMFHY